MTDELKGIPDVQGLEQFVQDSQEQPGAESKEAPPAAEKQEEKADLGQFKTPEALYKSYKEIQGYTTKVSQENKALKDQLSEMQEQIRLIGLQNQYQPPVQQTQTQDFDTQFINDPKRAIDSVVNQRVAETIRTMTAQEVLQEEQASNPEEFNERYQYAMLAKQNYPNLVNTSQGIRMLFKLGDKIRKESARRNAEKAMKMLFGEDVDYDKLKTIVKKDQQLENKSSTNLAYMPDSSGAFRTGMESDRGNIETQISSAADKGDVDTVLDGLFKRAGLKK